MPQATLSPGTAAQLLGLGIPAEKHNFEDLRNMLPSFQDLDQATSTELLAEIVIYLTQHQILPLEKNAWKDLPWGSHACLFYKTNNELPRQLKNYFAAGLQNNEKCIWIVPRNFEMERAEALMEAALKETRSDSKQFELIRHQNWYEDMSGRFRKTEEIVMGWVRKVDEALHQGYEGIRVSGDAHCHPDELKNFFEYERTVNGSIGTMKIKALCGYCIPRFAPEQITHILETHQNVFGELAVLGKVKS